MIAKIGVALRLTPRRIDVDPLTGTAAADRAPATASAAGLAALEVALSLAATWSAEVTVAAAAPATADPMLRDALARGAHHAVRIAVSPDRESGVPGLPNAIAATAGALAAALADCPVVVCGDGGLDGTGAVPALLAAHGGRAQALGLIKVAAGEPGVVHAERRLDRGWRERLRVRAPMVISVESAAAQPRRAPLAGLLAAREAGITVLPGADVAQEPVSLAPYRPRARAIRPPAGDSPLARMLSLVGTAADHKDPPRRIRAEPTAAAREILNQLGAWGYL